MNNQPYPIGVAGQKWGDAEKAQWLAAQKIKRSYRQEVLSKLDALRSHYDVVQYGELNYQQNQYPLYVIKSRDVDNDKPTVLITGGVHGYETSGVQGAIRFATEAMNDYLDSFNFIVAPCLSPWGYETINRWNPDAIDPNRSFYPDSPAQEAAAIMALMDSLAVNCIAHIDLHETTDTDNSEFRPALAARDGSVHDNWNIPDGFYLVADTHKPELAFQQAMIEAVAKVTHIAPADDNNRLIGVPIEFEGVIKYDTKKLGLCAGLTDAPFVSTTEVYPDSPLVDDENCILAQVAAITGGLDFIKTKL